MIAPGIKPRSSPHGRTQSKNATFSCASRKCGSRSYCAQCCLATSVAPSMSPEYPTWAELALPWSRKGFGPVQAEPSAPKSNAKNSSRPAERLNALSLRQRP